MPKMIKSKYDLIGSDSFKRDPFYASDIAEENHNENTIESLKRPLEMVSYPPRIRLELTNACNLNCSFCYQPHFTSEDKDLLTVDDIKRLSPLLKKAKFISFALKAEPLMSPHLVPIMDEMSNYNSIFSLYTNAQLLTEKVSLALIRNKINFLTISICSFDENYSTLQKGGNIEKVIKNIEDLNRLKEKHNSTYPKLRLSFILRMDTINNLDDALDFVKKYNFSEGIQFLMFYRFVESDKHLEPIFHWDKVGPILKSFKEKAKRENVLVEVSSEAPDGMITSSTEKYIKTCFDPWESFNVAPNGDVTSCALGAVMGNIRAENPVELWNNDEFKKFRNKMNSKPYNKICEQCWHCRHVSVSKVGDTAVKLDRIYGSFYRKNDSG